MMHFSKKSESKNFRQKSLNLPQVIGKCRISKKKFDNLPASKMWVAQKFKDTQTIVKFNENETNNNFVTQQQLLNTHFWVGFRVCPLWRAKKYKKCRKLWKALIECFNSSVQGQALTGFCPVFGFKGFCNIKSGLGLR